MAFSNFEYFVPLWRDAAAIVPASVLASPDELFVVVVDKLFPEFRPLPMIVPPATPDADPPAVKQKKQDQIICDHCVDEN